MDRKKTEESIRRLKCGPFGRCSLKGLLNQTSFSLDLLTADMAKNDEIIALLASWRKATELFFSETFEITFEGTRKWFSHKLIDEPDRLLFIIKIGGGYIGHVGIFRFDHADNSCEIDNIIRGKPGFSGIIQSGIQEMVRWGAKTFGLESYTLQVASDNPRAVALYQRMGFVETSRTALVRTVTADGYIKWVDAPKTADDIQRYNVHMRLNLGENFA